MFRKKTSKYDNYVYHSESPLQYPAGTCVKTDKCTYFIMKDGKRYRITSDNVELSWRFPLTVITSESALSNYPVALSKLPFRDGSLLNNFADGKLYLVSEGLLHHITDPRFLDRIQRNRDDAMVVSDADIKIMKVGAPIT